MNPRKVYLRKKEGGYIFEGKRKGKTVYIWTIPKDYELFLRELAKSSFFSKDKSFKILEILSRLDYKPEKEDLQPQIVPVTNIKRTSGKDEVNELFEDIKGKINPGQGTSEEAPVLEDESPNNTRSTFTN